VKTGNQPKYNQPIEVSGLGIMVSKSISDSASSQLQNVQPSVSTDTSNVQNTSKTADLLPLPPDSEQKFWFWQ